MTLVRQPMREATSVWDAAADTLLAGGIDSLGQPSTPAQLQQFRTYGELLLKWNSTYNLLGATSTKALVEEHLLDSVAVNPALDRWLPPLDTLVDVGSGAGFPGLVLAILAPDRPLVLVEPIGKKAAFLRQAIAQCRLSNVRVLEARIQDADRGLTEMDKRRQPHPTPRHFICRAFTSLDAFVESCRRHASGRSLFFSMKAARVGEELDGVAPSIEVLAIEALSTAGKDVQRHLVVMRARDVDTSVRARAA